MIIILMGVAGSGKTTIGESLAQQLGWPFYDGDDFHPPANIARMSIGIALTDDDRQAWLSALAAHITACLQAEISAVVACSALKQKYRSILMIDQQVHFVYLKGSYELILKRLQQRGNHFMRPDMLPGQFAALEEPEDALVVDIGEDPAQIVSAIINWLKGLKV